MSDRCEECGGSFDRPGLLGCIEGHTAPDVAWSILMAVEDELNDRRGLKWEGLDDETLDELRDTLHGLIRKELEE